jgi:TatA/E family protein of Tat protein translocase
MIAPSLTFAFIEGLGGPEIMVIFFIVLILFGGQKLPEFARGLGKAVREFKKATAEMENEIKKVIETPPEPPPPPAIKPAAPAIEPPKTPPAPPATS